MNKVKYLSLLLILSLGFNLSLSAQTDNRNRTAETIIADGLAQLPAQTSKDFNQVIGEMAGTGQKGMTMLIGMLKPSNEAKNGTFENAINGITKYVSAKDKANLRGGIIKALSEGIENTSDRFNKAFLFSQLQILATSNEAGLFEKYLNDKDMQEYAVRGLADIPGIDNRIVSLMKAGKGPKSGLAYIAYFRKLQGVEDILQSWIPGADKSTLGNIYNGLTVCGTASSVKTLEAAAKTANFAMESTGATDSYLQLLNNLADKQIVIKEAKKLIKNERQAIRCAGLRLLLKADNKNASKTILAALKDKNIQYRNTALFNAKEYAGEGIVATVCKKAKSYSPEAQTDIVHWLGNNHESNQIALVNSFVGSDNDILACAAIEASSKMGGNEALTTLIQALGGKHSAEAESALLTFKGNINNGVMEALSSNTPAIQNSALRLASSRHIYNAYDKVLTLTKSSDATTKAAAYEALKGVVEKDNFNQVCSLMEQASEKETIQLQEAAKNAIHALTPDQQYSMIESMMKSTSKPALYYPLLAQAGNSQSIDRLQQEYKTGDKKAAFKSMLNVNNPEMIDVLYTLAKEDESGKDAILNRYMGLVSGSANNAEVKYLLYRRALELNPSDNVKKKLVNELKRCPSTHSIMYAASYLDNQATAYTAAFTVSNLAKEGSLQGGPAFKNILVKTQQILKPHKDGGDAEAGYAIDEIAQILSKASETGVEALASLPSESLENFELYLDWKATGNATLNLRSMPQIALTPQNATLFGMQNATSTSNDWNTLYVKVVDDRLLLFINGVKVVENWTLKNTSETAPLNAEGIVSLTGDAQVRSIYITKLPKTPVFTLSNEEKKAGFEVLFDGRSLEKWTGNKTAYIPQDGCIYVTANYGGQGNLYTASTYKDFIYRFEFCFDVPGVNNGIGIRTKHDVDAAYDGMEIQVLDHDDPIYANLQPYQQHGSVYGIIVPEHVNFGTPGTWHVEEIQAIGDNIKVTVDGKVINDGNIRKACQGHNVAPDGSNTNPYTVDHKNHPGLFNKEGYISFCGHGAGVKFRNVRILDLSKKKKK